MLKGFLNKILPWPSATANLGRMKDSVCALTSYQSIRDGRVNEGNGVFLRRDMILTSLHIVEGAEIVYATGGDRFIGSTEWGRAPYAADASLDLAILKLKFPMKVRPALLGGDNYDHLADRKGWLVTYFTGEATSHPAGRDAAFEEAINVPKDIALRCAFSSALEIKKGYSGSPVFDSCGRLSTIACSVLNADPTLFFGPTPHRVSAFVRQVLDR